MGPEKLLRGGTDTATGIEPCRRDSQSKDRKGESSVCHKVRNTDSREACSRKISLGCMEQL